MRESEYDLVIPVKYTPGNDELRYAVRSMQENLPFRQLVVVGYCPGWLTPDYQLHFNQGQGSKYLNTTHIMALACQDPNISDPFIWTNDDVFAIQAMPGLPLMNRGPVERVLRAYTVKGSSKYAQGMEDTLGLMEEFGLAGPYMSYELHMPMLIEKGPMREVLAMTEERVPVLHKRTFYGNWVSYGGLTVPDCKVYRESQNWSSNFPFVSTSDESFKHFYVGTWVRHQFPTQSRWEKGIFAPYHLVSKNTSGRPVENFPVDVEPECSE